MPALKSFSAAKILCRSPQTDRSNPEAEEKEEDLYKMNGKDEDGSKDGDEEDVKRDEVEAEDEEALEEEEEDSKKPSQSSSSEEQSDTEYMDIELSDIRRDVQCPICLGIIKKTRTAMECLHRFCQECIDKSIRLGNNECPTCRKHCASRRALRDDPRFDAFIATLFKNIDKYEAEESAFHKDDEARNKQIQVSIAQVSQRQSEALAKRKSIGKEAVVLALPSRVGSVSRGRSCRNMEQETSEAIAQVSQLQSETLAKRKSTGKEAVVFPIPECVGSGFRRKKSRKNMEQETSEAHGGKNKRGKDSSSDEPCAENPQRNRKKCCTTRPSSSGANNKKNVTEEGHHRESRGISPGLAWGRGGARSNTRQGNNNQGATSRSVNVRNARLNKLVDYLGSLESNSVELDIHVKLISLDTKSLPNLLQPYLRCQPTLLGKQLREYVALNLKLEAEEVELLVSKGDDKEIENPHVLMKSSASTENLQSLKDDETLAKLKVDCISNHALLVVLYGKSKSG